MAKTSGLGDNYYVGGYNVSGDINSLGKIGGGPNPLEFTGIDKSAYERKGGLRDGSIEFVSYFNPSAGQAHPVLAALPTTDIHTMYMRGTAIGNDAACLVGKQANYDGTRADDGGFTFQAQVLANGYGLEWGTQLTAGLRTDSSATNGTGVAFEGPAFVLLPGSSGNTATTPDAAALDITGDLDIRVKLSADDWTPSSDSYLLSKYTTTGNQRSYALALTSTGVLALQWSADGTNGMSKNATANLASLANGTTKWVRATLDVDNGASGHTVRFYTSDDGSAWTQLGTAVTTAGTTSVYASTAALELGSRNGGTSDFLAGKIYEAEVKNGIGGTTVAHPVATASGFTDVTGLVWTANGTASFSNWTQYGAQAYLQVTSFTGTDVTIKIQDSYDNSSWSDVSGLSFAPVTSAPSTQRLAVTGNLKRYLRAVTTTSGGFTSATFAVAIAKNETAVDF
ncbi:hypothetical protein [Streptomyces pseudogriseolus]|uniref:hypothetical protein n=1 Tax=Streptomyces pseudogriseolus TaxID=36817 RepID=UPI003FA29864